MDISGSALPTVGYLLINTRNPGNRAYQDLEIRLMGISNEIILTYAHVMKVFFAR